MIVPRSAIEVDKDDEYSLYAVTTFKKHSHDFIHKCRELKWTPRDFTYREGGREEERKEVDKVGREGKEGLGRGIAAGTDGMG